MKLQEVRESALALPLRARRKLVHELAESVTNEEGLGGLVKSMKYSKATTAEWKAEIKRRIDAYERGETKTIPGEKVMAWLRKRAG